MGSRIDELEQSINDLRAEMGADNSPSPSVPPAPKDDSKSPNES
ncbi:Heat shock factor binding 1 [Corchorus capsularis]|uniref:Heat shock factor binding 1 n=1 Tax=Corchorus capsularis TaxID=210143 RepID=A0A1R3G6F7_COCAP|nr:Heat shock factor binding 1 [Corchorus capsularis]